MQTLWQDLRYGARMLLMKPGFSLTAILTLALGIGATTAIFTVVNAVLLRPLPYPGADRLVYAGQTYRGEFSGSGEPKFLFWREQSQSFEALACYSSFGGAQGNLTGGDEAEYVRGLRVSEDFFHALGVYPALGRAFTRAEDTPGGAPVAIMSDGLWRRRFGRNKEILGRTVSFNDRPMMIVGIMPPQFRFGSGADLFTPMQARQGAHFDPNAEVVGRLKRGVTLEQARAELKVIAEKYRAAFPRQMQDGESVGAQPYQELFVGGVRRHLWILLGAGGLLLLIACANVANLQLAQSAARRREIAVRMALGAGGGRIARQLLVESALLAAVGGAAGALLAVWGTDALVAALPENLLPSIVEIKVDWRVLTFAFGAALVTGVLFGLAPAWQARKVDVNSTLKEGGDKGGVARGRLRGALVVAEVALSLTLLAGAGLLTRTFANLMSVAPGFDPRGVLTLQVALDGPRYDTSQKAAAFYRDALERVSRLPGVEAAAVTNKLPLDWQFRMPVVLPEKPDQAHMTQFRMISPDYFRAMKISLRQGRAFSDADNAAAPPVIIVNETFARRFFDEQNPLARQVTVRRDATHQVVGVVADVKQEGLDGAPPPMVFVPIPQVSDRLMAVIRTFTPSYFTIRATGTRGLPPGLADAVKREVAAVDATLALSRIHSMEEVVGNSIASQRFNMLLVGLFAGLGLLLAGVGVYGVISYSVAQRTNEIGVRIALGARAVDVVRLVLKQALALAAIGVAIGLGASFALTRLMKGLLFGVGAADPLTFAVISSLLIGVAMVAALVPARRAVKVDPMAALRRE